MRWLFPVFAALLAGFSLQAQTPLDAKAVDKQLAETLREVHNRGATLFNKGDVNGCLRTFEGALEVAKGALRYRPVELKLIEEGMTEAAAIPDDAGKAHKLRVLLETTRDRLLGKESKKVETIPVLPRPAKKEEKTTEKKKEEKSGVDSLLKPVGGNKDAAPPGEPVIDPRKGLTGTLLWQGRPLEGIHIVFVQRDAERMRVFETVTGKEGKYFVDGIERSKYTTLLNPAPSTSPYVLPERYRTTVDSPLIYFISGPGDTLDFLLK